MAHAPNQEAFDEHPRDQGKKTRPNGPCIEKHFPSSSCVRWCQKKELRKERKGDLGLRRKNLNASKERVEEEDIKHRQLARISLLLKR